MPKIKTNRAAAKRFRKTASGNAIDVSERVTPPRADA